MKLTFKSFIKSFRKNFVQNSISSDAAELAYYLLFAFFPILMVVSASLSLAGKSLEDLILNYMNFFPESIFEIISGFLSQVSSKSTNITLLITGIFITLYSFARFTKSFKAKVRTIYDSKIIVNNTAEWIISFIFATFMLLFFYTILFVMLLGEHFIFLVSQSVTISPFVSSVLLTVGYFIPIISICFIVMMLYLISPGINQKFKDIIWGTVFSLIGFFMVSFLFTVYMNNFSSYSLIYGSIGALIALLLWFYFTSLVLLCGATINSIVIHHRKANLSTSTLP